MKEHFQDYGVRRWAGDDLIELQGEPLEAIQRLVEPYAPCILQGCGLNREENRIEPGLVALWKMGPDKVRECVKIARFGGCPAHTLPVYLTLECRPEERVYMDGGSKVIAYQYTARETTVRGEAEDNCPLTITAEGGPRLVDAMGITRKLDREGGDASLTKVVFGEENAEELKSGNTLAKLFGSIRQWLCNIKTKLDDLKPGLDGFGIFRINRTLTATAYQELSLLDFFPEAVLAGRTLQVGDFAIETSVYSYMYKITAVTDTTFNCERVCSLRGATGATGATGASGAEGLGIWRSAISATPSTTVLPLESISIPEGRSVKVGDLIIANSTYSYLYRVIAVSSTAATITYLTSLRGATGAAGSNATVTVDTALSDTSSNPVQNKVVSSAIRGLNDFSIKGASRILPSVSSSGLTISWNDFIFDNDFGNNPVNTLIITSASQYYYRIKISNPQEGLIEFTVINMSDTVTSVEIFSPYKTDKAVVFADCKINGKNLNGVYHAFKVYIGITNNKESVFVVPLINANIKYLYPDTGPEDSSNQEVVAAGTFSNSSNTPTLTSGSVSVSRASTGNYQFYLSDPNCVILVTPFSSAVVGHTVYKSSKSGLYYYLKLFSSISGTSTTLVDADFYFMILKK